MKTMKLLVIAIGFIATMTSTAQNNFKLGVNAGLNYPDVRGNELARYNNFKVGYLVGVSFDYYLKEHLSIKTNINYEQKIKSLEITYYNSQIEEIGREEYEEVYKYINVPILLKLEFWDAKFYVNGGPFLNYLLSSKLDEEYPNDNSDFVSEKKKIDFGVSLGVGTIFSINEKNDIAIEVRDDFGLVDTGGAPTYVNGTVKTNTIKLILSWNLGI
jgi:hypothetical protein